MLSIMGGMLVVLCVGLLLTGRINPFIIFSTIPIIIAFIAGFSFTDIQGFFSAGLVKVTPIAVMFIFAILFFALMQEKGLFEPLIQHIIRKTNDHVEVIPLATVLIATLAHLDGSGASTFLICIPALLPIYQRVNLSPYLLLLLISASASVMNMLPWGGPVGRAASVIQVDPTQLWYPLIPIQISALVILMISAYILGLKERSRILQYSTNNDHPTPSIGRPSIELPPLWWKNFTLTIALIGILMGGFFPSALVFMMGLSLALLINRLSAVDQRDFMNRNAWNALQMAMIIFAAGIFLGVLKESKMLHALAENLVGILPELLLTHIHIMIGFLGVPFELILNTDAYYFALLPIVEQTVSPFGVTSTSVVYALLIGNIIGTFVSPFSPAVWLALGLSKLEIGPYLKYAFRWIWGLSIILMCIAWGVGLF